MAAVLGGVTVLLPPALSGGTSSRPFRAFGYFLGVILAMLVIGVLAIVVPPVPADNGAVTAWAIVIAALLAVLVIGRSLALPMLLGAIATAISMALMASYEPDSLTLMIITLLPAMVTMMVASVIIGIWRPAAEIPDVGADGTLAPTGGSPTNPARPEELVPMLQGPAGDAGTQSSQARDPQ